MAGDAAGRSLEHTTTWAFAAVCFFIISVSVLIEHSIHLLTNWLKRHRKKGLYEAVDKLKSELMLLGFMSLLLAVTQKHISKICIPSKLANIMLPCRKPPETAPVEHLTTGLLRNLLSLNHVYNNSLLTIPRRGLADGGDGKATGGGSATTTNSCSNGKASLVSQEGIHQLHIFIFVLAVMQIVYSGITMALGRAKMSRWKVWEDETQTTEYKAANDPNRFRFTRQTTFGRRHMTDWTESTFLLWIKCFFRQFFNSVAKVDYLTLRHGFIAAHSSARHSNFNFQKHIQRSLEEDFKVIVSISPLMWLIVVILMLLDVYGWYVYLWVSYVPPLIVLVLGTKLEVVVTRMALQLKNQNSVVVGTPLVQPHDDLFWFGQPRFVLSLLHLTLFVNAFELAFFVWVTFQFGFHSCYHENTVIIITRVALAVTVQVLCSYITLPLYALVTQMGSKVKSKGVESRITSIMKQWHTEVRQRRMKQEYYSMLSPRTSLSTDWSLRNSPPDYSSHVRPTSTSLSTDWSLRNSPDYSSHARPSLTAKENNNIDRGGEITEEEINTGEVVAAGSSWVPYRAPSTVELSNMRRNM